MNAPRSLSPLFSPSIRRLFNWRTLRRTLLVLACLGTLVAVFYTEENWRGKRAWEKCRRDLETKGEMLDWNAFIPAPIPNDQNIFKAPNIQEWFVKPPPTRDGNNASSNRSGGKAPFVFALPSRRDTNSLLLADVQVLSSNASLDSGKADAVLRFDDPAARTRASNLLHDAAGPTTSCVTFYTFLARPLDQINPLRFILQADTALGSKDLERFFPTNLIQVSSVDSRANVCLRVASAGNNSFHVSLTAPVHAAEYLAWTEPLTPDFDTVRNALARPYARIDGDYEQPWVMPIPNFVRVRTVIQILAQRAQCFLLLGHPEAAWRELALLRDLCRLLHTQPVDRPLTLVAQMIDTAVTGVYVMVVEDGLRLRAWREPQLVAIQQQLGQINLLPALAESLRTERVAFCHDLETTSLAKLAALIRPDAPKPSLWALWERMKEPLVLVPRGWIYQNMAAISDLEQGLVGVVNVADNVILTRRAEEQHSKLLTTISHFSPYTFLAAIGVPNCLRASQTVALNQTRANEALIACGLERYRLVNGRYPENLDALLPQLIASLPHDLIGGRPLKYRRTADDHFVLYSVGWNEKDDGGVSGGTLQQGDWVWEYR